jgi:hypothetical protein
MLTKDVFKFFGGRVSEIAATADVTRDAVYKWRKNPRVPPVPAMKLHEKTGGKLKFDPADYVGKAKQRESHRASA